MKTKKQKFNGSYQTDIIQRMFSEAEMQTFHDDYTEVCHNVRSFREPTKQDLQMYKMWRTDQLTISEISQQLNSTHARVQSAIVRAARVV